MRSSPSSTSRLVQQMLLAPARSSLVARPFSTVQSLQPHSHKRPAPSSNKTTTNDFKSSFTTLTSDLHSASNARLSEQPSQAQSQTPTQKIKPLVNSLKPISKPNLQGLSSTLAEYNKAVSSFNTDALSVIRWAVENFDGKVAMSTSFGIQSAVLLHLATQVYPDIPIVWVDTGYLPKETYVYAEELKSLLNLNLTVKTNDSWTPARMEAVYGKLWETDHIHYGRMRKVEPLNSGLDQLDPQPLALLSGLRANQTQARANMETVGYQNGRFKVLPMLKMTDEDVAKYMDMYDLPPHPLQAKGYVTVGDAHSSRPLQEGENARDTRFGGKFQECGLHAEEEIGATTSASSGNVVQDNLGSVESFRKTGVAALESVSAHPETEMSVIMVKKIIEDGSYCRKCNDVATKMEQDGLAKWIGYTGYADVRDVDSEGMRLAKHFNIATAPFSLVRSLKEERANEEWRVVRSYLQLRKMLDEAVELVEKKKNEERDLRGSVEFLEASKHVKELEAHLERLRSEQEAAKKKLEDTKSFFSEKFKLREDSLPVF